jgi:hypothetical protein
MFLRDNVYLGVGDELFKPEYVCNLLVLELLADSVTRTVSHAESCAVTTSLSLSLTHTNL